MSINMLVFEYRETEHAFFENNSLKNFNIKFFTSPLNEETLKEIPQELVDNAMIISVFIESEVTEDVINKFKNLRIISTRSTGVDHINCRAAKNRNICIINVENYGSTSVAQFTFGLILALVRKIVISTNCMKELQKSSMSFVGRDLSKLSIGVIGTGAIGGAVCRLAHFFGMKILAYDLNEKQELKDKFSVQYTSLENLLQKSDVVTLHTPYTGKNKNMISYPQFEMMKKTSYFINTSRGEIVDTRALKKALDENQISGVALDVVNCESYSLKCEELISKIGGVPMECHEEVKIINEIVKYPNVIITPHIAYETQDSIDYILQKSFEGIVDTIKGGSNYFAV